jgi:hypothetical protein
MPSSLSFRFSLRQKVVDDPFRFRALGSGHCNITCIGKSTKFIGIISIADSSYTRRQMYVGRFGWYLMVSSIGSWQF